MPVTAILIDGVTNSEYWDYRSFSAHFLWGFDVEIVNSQYAREKPDTNKKVGRLLIRDYSIDAIQCVTARRSEMPLSLSGPGLKPGLFGPYDLPFVTCASGLSATSWEDHSPELRIPSYRDPTSGRTYCSLEMYQSTIRPSMDFPVFTRASQMTTIPTLP